VPSIVNRHCDSVCSSLHHGENGSAHIVRASSVWLVSL
jgi:hypothetical protein